MTLTTERMEFVENLTSALRERIAELQNRLESSGAALPFEVILTNDEKGADVAGAEIGERGLGRVTWRRPAFAVGRMYLTLSSRDGRRTSSPVFYVYKDGTVHDRP